MILFTENQIRDRISMLALKIGGRYPHGNMHLVSILRSSVIFAADLMRALPTATTINFVSLDNEIASEIGEVGGRDVLIVDVLVSSGRTMNYIVEEHNLRPRKPRSVRTVTLLDQPSRREIDAQVDYVGFEIGSDTRPVGYGLDYEGRYRGLSHITAMGS